MTAQHLQGGLACGLVLGEFLSGCQRDHGLTQGVIVSAVHGVGGPAAGRRLGGGDLLVDHAAQ